MSLTVVDGPTIPAGESLSDGVDCSSGDIIRITVPQEFTPSNLTFQVSSDGNFYNDLFTAQGGEVMIGVQPNTGVVIVGNIWGHAINFIKFRSGSRSHPVLQKEDCRFAIAVETLGAPAASSAPSAREAAPSKHK